MPNRVLREGILTSRRIALLSWPAEVFYRRVMSVVDDFGRYYATPGLLRAACYPRQLTKVSDQDVGKWLEETRKAGLVGVYQVDEEEYLELLDFRQHRRADKSKFPQPPSDAVQMQRKCSAEEVQVRANEHLGVCEGVGEVSVEPEGSPPSLGLPLVDGSQMPVTEAMVAEWGSAFPAVDVMQQLREMRAWCLANPARRKTKRGITGFIVRWLGKEQDRGNVVPLKPVDKFAGVL